LANDKRSSLVRPSKSTPFHIDFSWWQQNDREWRIYLRSLLCSEHQEVFAGVLEDELTDWVDPDTAEVQQVDGLQHILLSHCAQADDFLGEHTALVESIFRLFIKNGNSPMSVEELAEKLNRPATPILRTLSGARVYRGIRPIVN
jgi:hypothetical protein